MRALAAVTLAATLVLSACGSGGGESPSVESPPSSQSAGTPSSAAPATETSAAEQKTATEIGNAIKSEIPEVSKVVTITEDNDPNDLIGRPGGYVDAAVLYDSRAEPTDQEPGVDQGAFLEVWPDEASATDRAEYIQSLKSGGSIFGTEYHYQHGGYLLRVTGEIKPSEAKAYEAAFNSQF